MILEGTKSLRRRFSCAARTTRRIGCRQQGAQRARPPALRAAAATAARALS
jgi:hypothetical protein